MQEALNDTQELKDLQKQKKKMQNRRGKRLFYLIIPFVILVLLFSYYPLFGWVYAFFDYQPPIPLSQSEFVGWKSNRPSISEHLCHEFS